MARVSGFEPQEQHIKHPYMYTRTVLRVSQLLAHNTSIVQRPELVTDSTPHVVHTDLHTTIVSGRGTSQADGTISTGSCGQREGYSCSQ